jgi:DNA-binding transcriptional LysR family regulator
MKVSLRGDTAAHRACCPLKQGGGLKDVLTFRLYTRVARLGSFSAAARECGLAQSQVSRMIAELEASLGARLLTRTTRAVVPTEAGLEFLGRMEPILAAIDDAENSVRETGELRGVLRLAMPSTMAMRVVMPRLSAFTERHPLLRLEIMLDDRWQDMIREAVDVGIRVGSLPDSAGTARLIGKMHRVVVASPAYLDLHGTPAIPERNRLRGNSSAMARRPRSTCNLTCRLTTPRARLQRQSPALELSRRLHGRVGRRSTTERSCTYCPNGKWPSCPCMRISRWGEPPVWRGAHLLISSLLN